MAENKFAEKLIVRRKQRLTTTSDLSLQEQLEVRKVYDLHVMKSKETVDVDIDPERFPQTQGE